jgi:hypothetical protein
MLLLGVVQHAKTPDYQSLVLAQASGTPSSFRTQFYHALLFGNHLVVCRRVFRAQLAQATGSGPPKKGQGKRGKK